MADKALSRNDRRRTARRSQTVDVAYVGRGWLVIGLLLAARQLAHVCCGEAKRSRD